MLKLEARPQASKFMSIASPLLALAITVVIGDPVDVSDLRERAGEQAALNEATTRLMNAITALLEEIRDEKAPAERWNPASHGQKETGRLDS